MSENTSDNAGTDTTGSDTANNGAGESDLPKVDQQDGGTGSRTGRDGGETDDAASGGVSGGENSSDSSEGAQGDPDRVA